MWKESFDFLAQQVQCFRVFVLMVSPFSPTSCWFLLKMVSKMNFLLPMASGLTATTTTKNTHIYFQVHPISLFVWVFPVRFGWKLVGWLVLYSSRRQPQWQSVSSFFTRALAFERFLQRVYINQMWPCMEYTFPSLNQQFAPENRPAQKESSFPTFIFQGQC